MITKTCTICKVDQPVSEFSPDKKAKDKLFCQCKTCSRARNAAFRKINADRVAAISKTCIDCKTSKPASEFHKSQTSTDRLFSWCKPCAAIRVIEYRGRNRGAYNNVQRNYRARKISANMRHWDPELFDFVLVEAEQLRTMRESITGIKWHLDHVVALKNKLACGLHFPTNWAIIPARANISKGSR